MHWLAAKARYRVCCDKLHPLKLEVEGAPTIVLGGAYAGDFDLPGKSRCSIVQRCRSLSEISSQIAA